MEERKGGDPMTEESFKRKLTAILSADVQGYSRLMGEDEDATIRTLTSYRELMSTLIQKHRGRVVDSPGDNLLAEFLSVVDAVRCAVEIQEELRVRNAELPENRKMVFRIGINLGDVVQEEERIYGDGINIAARVEGLAEGGGICISGTVYDSIKNKLSLSYESLGEHTVKNIKEPVRVYRMRVGPEAVVKTVPRRWHKATLAGVAVLVVLAGAWAIWNFYFRPPPIEPASVEKMAYPLPDKPSIAVLPFENLSGDPDQEYIGDGITENIITALSKIPEMFVIARNSTFTYKGKPVKIRQVSEELGVRYVLEGSVQKAGDRLRVTAQLIDAIGGHHLWAERYDRDLRDLFTLQDEITMKILTALEVTLTRGEVARAHETENLEAWGYLVRASSFFWRVTKEDNAKARELIEQALKLDPDYASALAVLGSTHLMAARMGWSESPAESVKEALELGQKAIALCATEGWAHRLLVSLYTMQRQYDMAIAEGERAIALGPNDAEAHSGLAYTLHYAGRFEDAIVHIKKAMRLRPYYPPFYLMFLADSYFMVGRYDESIAVNKQLLERARKGEWPIYSPHLGLAANYMLLGQEEEAQFHAAEVLRTNPKFSLEVFGSRNPYKDPADMERWLDSLRRAGLPEKPPLPLPDKPSIAVLPFVNMSGDPEQEYFSDGLTEEIITALSKVPKLFVIARQSSFTYKGKSISIPTVGRELGVKYVLEGSVRKAGDKVRITAQLIDAKTNHHLWAERYERELKDIFAVQDEITMKIITAMQVKLTEGEQARVVGKGTDNIEAYAKLIEARGHIIRLNKHDNILARQKAEEAIALDSDYAVAYAILSTTHWLDVMLGSSKSPRQSMGQAMELAQKAISLDDSVAMAHSSLGLIYTLRGQYEKGISECERAVALEPNNESAYRFLGLALRYADRREEAIPVYQRAIRLSPIPKSTTLFGLGLAYIFTGRYEEGVAACKKAVDIQPNNILAQVNLTFAYTVSGREEEARATAAQVLRLDPDFSVARFAKKTLKYKNKSDTERFVVALRKAGLPD
jgi:adenylate cyclase